MSAGKRKVFSVVVGLGVTKYWIAAHSLPGALLAFLDGISLMGEMEELEGYQMLSVEAVSDEKAKRTPLVGEPDSNMLAEASDATADFIIGCSEWD